MLQYQAVNMEILARAVPESLKMFAEWRQLRERLKIEGRKNQEIIRSIQLLILIWELGQARNSL